MARPKNEQPTPAELEVLQILWESQSLTVREVMDRLNEGGRSRAYTSVMSLLNVMADKKFLERKPFGRAFKYAVLRTRENTLGSMLNDLVTRAFEGSRAALVAQLLDATAPDSDELREIQRLIRRHQKTEDQQ